ncbi:MAG: aminotransferase class I/II-fold pyridoxal phosphate-dependent enzyme [bacterium]
MESDRRGVGTRAVHGGEERVKAGHGVTVPIVQTATYAFRDTGELCDYMEGRIERPEYGRYGNPTQAAAERKLAALDGGESALLFSSGMAAVTTAMLALLSQGQHVVLTSDCYRRTRQFCRAVLSRFGVEFTLVEPDDWDALEGAIRPTTRLIVSESPTNPYLHVIDLERLVTLARKHKVKTLIDSTFATPVNQRPLEFGVDLVVHSATKYLGGHNDLLAGAIVGGDGLVSVVRELQAILGAVPDPHACYLLIRGLKTLAIRVERQNASALAVARFLAAHPRVTRVHYPGLETHPQHAIAAAQMTGFGGVVAFEIDGTLDDGSRFIDAMRIPYIAPSLGGVESLIEQPALMSYYELAPEERAAVGIRENLIRFSIGIEDAADLIADLDQALAILG